MDDPRTTPARPDLAAKYLEGKVEAKRFVEGDIFEIVEALAPDGLSSGADEHPRATTAPSADPEDV